MGNHNYLNILINNSIIVLKYHYKEGDTLKNTALLVPLAGVVKMTVQVKGASCSLSESLITRLLSLGTSVICDNQPHHQQINSVLLTHSEAKLLDSGNAFSISFDNSDADIVIGVDLIISDLIPSRPDNKWSAQPFLAWAQGESTFSDNVNWWLAEADAASAIARICRAKKLCDAIELCGRRSWKEIDTFSEFSNLWQRTVMGQSGNFTPQILSHKPISGMDAIPITEESATRPKLDATHSLLNEIDGEGWRPLTPLRTALMTLIAGIIEYRQPD